MKKLILTLAVATLFSSAAFAETGPTVPANINCKDIAAKAAEAAKKAADQSGATAIDPNAAPAK